MSPAILAFYFRLFRSFSCYSWSKFFSSWSFLISSFLGVELNLFVSLLGQFQVVSMHSLIPEIRSLLLRADRYSIDLRAPSPMLQSPPPTSHPKTFDPFRFFP